GMTSVRRVRRKRSIAASAGSAGRAGRPIEPQTQALGAGAPAAFVGGRTFRARCSFDAAQPFGHAPRGARRSRRSLHPVLAFVLRRLLQSLLVLGLVAFIAFGLFNFTGDPIVFMVGQDATVQDKARLRA